MASREASGERLDQARMVLAEALLEDVADLGRDARDAELVDRLVDPDQGLVALGLEAGGEVPVVEHGIELAVLDLLVQERRRAVDGLGLGLEVHAVALGGEAPDQEPALVDRAARDPDLLALEVGEARDVGTRRHHHGPDRARVGDEGQHLAVGALARHPEIVVDDRVDRSALERHVGRLAAAEALDLQVEIVLGVELVVLDDVELPVDGAELEHADPDRAEIGRRRGPAPAYGQQGQRRRRQDASMVHMPLPDLFRPRSRGARPAPGPPKVIAGAGEAKGRTAAIGAVRRRGCRRGCRSPAGRSR